MIQALFCVPTSVADAPDRVSRASFNARRETAQALINAGDYEVGIQQLTLLHSEYPDGELADAIDRSRSCWVKTSENRYEGCGNAHPTSNPPTSLVEASHEARRLYQLGQSAIQSGNYPEAIRNFELAFESMPHPEVSESIKQARRCWVVLSTPDSQDLPVEPEYQNCRPVTGDRYASKQEIHNLNEARNFYRKGDDLLGQGLQNCSQAISLFERAQALIPSPVTNYNIQIARRRCGSIPSSSATAAQPESATAALNYTANSRNQLNSQNRRHPDSPTVSCNLVEIARRDSASGRFHTETVDRPRRISHSGYMDESLNPGLKLESSGITIDISTQAPAHAGQPWSNSVRIIQSRSGPPLRIIPVSPLEDGNCPVGHLRSRIAVNRSAEVRLTDASNRPIEFTDAQLQPGQRSQEQRRCFALNDMPPRNLQKYYSLSCTQTRRRPIRPASVQDETPEVNPTAGSLQSH
jgi:tetratricopeptide (TPR) repeat protein